MLTVESTKVEGWEPAIRGMRNPMNSWDKSDTFFYLEESKESIEGRDCRMAHYRGLNEEYAGYFEELDALEPEENHPDILLGPNDIKLMKQLRDAGKDHAKYRRMVLVWCDILAPLYWWKEFDTYKVGTVANSCSTMHKIAAKEFTLDDFSHEHLDDYEGCVEDDDGGLYTSLGILKLKIEALNYWRGRYNETKDKHAWYQMIQLLDSSYNQRRTVMLNYEVLANIYHARKDHKLDEWHTFCDWAKELPESWIFTGEDA